MQRGRRYSTDRMIDALRDEGITTGFDLGLMLDRLRDGRVTPSLNFDDDRSSVVSERDRLAIAAG